MGLVKKEKVRGRERGISTGRTGGKGQALTPECSAEAGNSSACRGLCLRGRRPCHQPERSVHVYFRNKEIIRCAIQVQKQETLQHCAPSSPRSSGWCPLKVERSRPKVRATHEEYSCLPLMGSTEEVLNGCLAKTKAPFISWNCYFQPE